MFTSQTSPSHEHEFEGMHVKVSPRALVYFPFPDTVRISVRVSVHPRWTSLWPLRALSVDSIDLKVVFLQAGPRFTDAVVTEQCRHCRTLQVRHTMPKISEFYPGLPWWRRIWRGSPGACIAHYSVTIVRNLTQATFQDRLEIDFPTAADGS